MRLSFLVRPLDPSFRWNVEALLTPNRNLHLNRESDSHRYHAFCKCEVREGRSAPGAGGRYREPKRDRPGRPGGVRLSLLLVLGPAEQFAAEAQGFFPQLELSSED